MAPTVALEVTKCSFFIPCAQKPQLKLTFKLVESKNVTVSFSVDDVLDWSHLAALTCLFRAIGPKERRSMQMSFSICKEKYQGKNINTCPKLKSQNLVNAMGPIRGQY